MQYILTEEEYKDLKVKAGRAARLPNEKTWQELCTRIADTMPVLWGWSTYCGEVEEPKPWGCIHSKATEWYCDSCPVQELCPSVKCYSK